MKKNGRLLGLMAWMVCLAMTTLFVQGATKNEPVAAKDPATDTKEAERHRVAANQSELKRLRLEDSAGWDETKLMTKPKENPTQEEKERVQRKVGALIGLCAEGRFARVAEVDSLKGMTAEEKAFCKARLDLVNPLLP